MNTNPVFGHLARLSTANGLFEHAQLSTPLRLHGYCLDDVARALVVTARQPSPPAMIRRLTRTYLDFTVAALEPDGRFHNRRSVAGDWTDEPGTDDHWGRGIWGLGTLASYTDDANLRRIALRSAAGAMAVRSPWRRSMAYAAIGAREVLSVRPGDPQSLELLADARDVLGHPAADPVWPWPEPRLAYANAVIPEAMLAIGDGLGDAQYLREGVQLLGWLLELQTRIDVGAKRAHLSVVPAGGWAPGEQWPGFDQQPIEVTALAEATWQAYELTGDSRWRAAVQLCAEWFLGANDAGTAVYDPRTGGGFDGLHADRVNQNQGAESTLAALATLQLRGTGRLAAA